MQKFRSLEGLKISWQLKRIFHFQSSQKRREKDDDQDDHHQALVPKSHVGLCNTYQTSMVCNYIVYIIALKHTRPTIRLIHV